MPCKKCRLERIEEKLNAVLEKLAHLKDIGEKLMALADDIKAAIQTLDAETTAVANNITALAAKIKNNMTDAEVTEVKAAFATLGDRLTGLAVDPTNPVPPPPAPLVNLRKKL